MKNLSLKLWSVFIAIALAYFVHGQGNRSVMPLIVPVEIQNLPAERVVLLPQSPQAQISLRGPSYVLSEIARNAPTFKIRIPEEAGNRYKSALRGDLLNLPPSVDILRIDPAEIEVVLDNLVTKKLKVEVPRIGSLKKDYRLEEIRVQPTEVLVRGPETEVESIDRVNTQQVDLRSITANEQLSLPLRLQGKFTTFEPDSVQVSVKVRVITRERRFKGVPVVVLGKDLQQKWTAEPGTVEIELSGPRPAIQALNKEEIQVFVEVPDGFSGEKKLPLKTRLPNKIQLVHVNPKEVRLKKESPAKEENG